MNLVCPICDQIISSEDINVVIHRQAHERDRQVTREEVRVVTINDRQECAFCRDPHLPIPPPGGSFRRDWEKHGDEHVVDKLEPEDEIIFDVRTCRVDGCDILEDVHEHVVDKLEPLTTADFPSLVHEGYRRMMKAEWDATAPTFEDTFESIFREAFDLLVERQKKYGPENIRNLGLYGVFSRIAHDKIERVRRSFKGQIVMGRVELDEWDYELADESFEDALFDIANYALIMVSLKRGVWGRPLLDEVQL